MKFYDNKESMMNYKQDKIKKLEKLIQGVEFLKEQIVEFDNKVFNKRVTNIINKNHKDKYNWIHSGDKDYCTYGIEYSSINVYAGYENEAYINIEVNSDNRIIVDETLIDINKKIEQLNKQKEKLSLIDDIMLSSFIERKREIEALIKNFNNDVRRNELDFADDMILRLHY